MNAPHLIRLRGPWQRIVLTTAETPPNAPVKVNMPMDIAEDLGPAFRGSVQYQRFFNQPTGIDESTKLRLSFEEVVGIDLEISLNGNLLGEFPTHAGRLSFDIRGQLLSRNQLCVRLGRPTDAKSLGPADTKYGMVGEVRLEIG